MARMKSMAGSRFLVILSMRVESNPPDCRCHRLGKKRVRMCSYERTSCRSQPNESYRHIIMHAACTNSIETRFRASSSLATGYGKDTRAKMVGWLRVSLVTIRSNRPFFDDHTPTPPLSACEQGFWLKAQVERFLACTSYNSLECIQRVLFVLYGAVGGGDCGPCR